MPAKPRPTAAARGYCSSAWRRIRLQVIARDGGICQLCGGLVQGEDRDAHVDHIVEKADGGSDAMSNLRLVHRSCHSRRHASDRLGGRPS
jgi:5-methylcytosine-specific restriction protein A